MMNKRISQLVVVVALCVLGGTSVSFLHAAPPDRGTAPEQFATADQLKQKAFDALKAGNFELSSDFLTKASAMKSEDLALARMARWTGDYEVQRQVFVTDRSKEYEKAVKDVHLLLDHNKDTFAMETAAHAYTLAIDKQAFRAEPWVVKLLSDAKALAEKYDANEQWLKSLRLYSQLTAIEPEVPEWKELLKTSTRRVRLLALYTPTLLKKVQEADAKEHEEVDAILHPTTQPTTKPAVDDAAEAANRMDWHESLKDVRVDMLLEAIKDARTNYYRDVNYAAMLRGGLSGLKVVVTMPGLETAFPGLADRQKRDAFLAEVDKDLDLAADKGKLAEQQSQVLKLILTLKETNEQTINLPEEVFVSEFADGAFSTLDPFSNIIWPSDWEEFQKTTKGEFSGVGIQIQNDEAGNLKVVSPLEDSPAWEARIQPDSIIARINGKSAKWISLNQAVKLITGPPDTDVTLTIKPPQGVEKDYTLTRRIIRVASVKGWLHRPGGGWEYMVDPDQKIGYLRLTNFTKTTKEDMRAALAEMSQRGVRGVIFDLRYDPGGLLNAATEVVNDFIDDKNDLKGLIVSTRPDRPDSPNNNAPPIMADSDGPKITCPLIVLVNQYSASASEIVSGALKDHGRALIVGERTFGKGSVQMLYPLHGQQAVLKLTTSHYYLPKGKCIHREENSKEWGVEPDITVEMTPEQMRAAIDARQASDILRDPAIGAAGAAPEPVARAAEGPTTRKSKDPLASDPQLSAALLLMRLKLAGAELYAQL